MEKCHAARWALYTIPVQAAKMKSKAIETQNGSIIQIMSTALITGATSGIGEACANAFAAAGRNLILIGRRKERLEKLKALAEEQGVTVRIFSLDVCDKKAVQSFSKANAKLVSEVEILVNNAGLAKGADPLQSGKPDDWDAMIDTNLKGFLYVFRAVIDPLIANRGHIVNLGSVAGYWIYPGGNVYCATKYAVRALTEGMRLDLHGKGVRVTEISPGLVDTEFSLVRFGDEEKARAVYQGIEALKPHDVADAVLWATSRPTHVNVQQIVLYPTDQASPRDVLRREPTSPSPHPPQALAP